MDFIKNRKPHCLKVNTHTHIYKQKKFRIQQQKKIYCRNKFKSLLFIREIEKCVRRESGDDCAATFLLHYLSVIVQCHILFPSWGTWGLSTISLIFLLGVFFYGKFCNAMDE